MKAAGGKGCKRGGLRRTRALEEIREKLKEFEGSAVADQADPMLALEEIEDMESSLPAAKRWKKNEKNTVEESSGNCLDAWKSWEAAVAARACNGSDSHIENHCSSSNNNNNNNTDNEKSNHSVIMYLSVSDLPTYLPADVVSAWRRRRKK